MKTPISYNYALLKAIYDTNIRILLH
uniref:Uncharacterized protein n=1 Tax=Rhizophora mucronata TaxID=61149 RepID=A0A2P2PVK7_RHIMU